MDKDKNLVFIWEEHMLTLLQSQSSNLGLGLL